MDLSVFFFLWISLLKKWHYDRESNGQRDPLIHKKKKTAKITDNRGSFAVLDQEAKITLQRNMEKYAVSLWLWFWFCFLCCCWEKTIGIMNAKHSFPVIFIHFYWLILYISIRLILFILFLFILFCLCELFYFFSLFLLYFVMADPPKLCPKLVYRKLRSRKLTFSVKCSPKLPSNYQNLCNIKNFKILVLGIIF
jgi:hypothetical protein